MRLDWLECFIPYWILRILNSGRGVGWRRIGDRWATKLVVDIMPMGVAAILSQRSEEDRSVFKYWVPYGKMVRFVSRKYGESSWNGVPFPQDIGLIRELMPYGLVLWYDQKHNGINRFVFKNYAPAAVRRSESAVSVRTSKAESLQEFSVRLNRLQKDLAKVSAEVVSLHRILEQRLEHLEILLLRCQIQNKQDD